MTRNIINRNISEPVNKIAELKINSRPVLINNDVYLSIKLASLFLKINRTTIIYRLKSDSDKFKDWRYLDLDNVVDRSLVTYELMKIKKLETIAEDAPWD